MIKYKKTQSASCCEAVTLWWDWKPADKLQRAPQFLQPVVCEISHRFAKPYSSAELHISAFSAKARKQRNEDHSQVHPAMVSPSNNFKRISMRIFTEDKALKADLQTQAS